MTPPNQPSSAPHPLVEEVVKKAEGKEVIDLSPENLQALSEQGEALKHRTKALSADQRRHLAAEIQAQRIYKTAYLSNREVTEKKLEEIETELQKEPEAVVTPPPAPQTGPAGTPPPTTVSDIIPETPEGEKKIRDRFQDAINKFGASTLSMLFGAFIFLRNMMSSDPQEKGMLAALERFVDGWLGPPKLVEQANELALAQTPNLRVMRGKNDRSIYGSWRQEARKLLEEEYKGRMPELEKKDAMELRELRDQMLRRVAEARIGKYLEKYSQIKGNPNQQCLTSLDGLNRQLAPTNKMPVYRPGMVRKATDAAIRVTTPPVASRYF